MQEIKKFWQPRVANLYIDSSFISLKQVKGGLRCQGFSNNIYTCQKSAQSLRKRKRRGGKVVEKDKRGLALSLIYMFSGH